MNKDSKNGVPEPFFQFSVFKVSFFKGEIIFHILLQNPRSNSKTLRAATPPSIPFRLVSSRSVFITLSHERSVSTGLLCITESQGFSFQLRDLKQLKIDNTVIKLIMYIHIYQRCPWNLKKKIIFFPEKMAAHSVQPLGRL